MTKEEIRAWYEEQFAKIDLKQLLIEAFFPCYVFNPADRKAQVQHFVYAPYSVREVAPGRFQKT